MQYAVYYKSRKLTPAYPCREYAQDHYNKLKNWFLGIEVKEVQK